MAKKAETRFSGNSIALYTYLSKRRLDMTSYITNNSKKLRDEMDDGIVAAKEQHLRQRVVGPEELKQRKIWAYMDMISQFFNLDYFTSYDCVRISELVENIKTDRLKVKSSMESYEIDISIAKKLADRAFQAIGCHFIDENSDEEYDKVKQSEARRFVDELQMLEYEKEEYAKEYKLLSNLLGIIARPKGFFSKLGMDGYWSDYSSYGI